MFQFDLERLFPNFCREVEIGRPLCAARVCIEAAQERVAMRRYLREHAKLTNETLRGMDTVGLRAAIREINPSLLA